jgi:hypothetical protein
MMVDLEFTKIGTNEYKISTRAIIGDTTLPSGVTNSIISNPSNGFDNWVYGFDGGVCFDPNPEPWDAADELTATLYPTYIDLPGGYVWSQPETREFYREDYHNPEGQSNNYMDYYIFYATDELTLFPIDDHTRCLESLEMAFYDEVVLEEVFIDWQEDPINNPSGKLYSGCFLDGADGYDKNNYYYIMHKTEGTFAHMVQIPPTHNPTNIED